jgi:hypothetical protein
MGVAFSWGKPQQTVSANVCILDQRRTTSKALLAALAALRTAEEDKPGLPN